MRLTAPLSAAFWATLTCLACLPGYADGLPVIFDMDTIVHKPGAFGEAKTPVGTVELVEGHEGQACKFTFVEGASGGFFTAWTKPDPEWDKAAGFSFWVKGDGSNTCGGLELIDASDYSLRYGYCFSIGSTEWHKVVVPWRDVIPELPAGQPVDPKTGYKPSGFGNFWFGKWFYWGTYPANSFAIDQIQLESAVSPDLKLPAASGLSRVRAKLKAKQPVKIVTMGDSLSDKRHWANRELLWSELLVSQLHDASGSDVKLVNPAIGGTQLTQNLILMPRWLQDTPKPDLVTVWFGFNDWDSGMRGERFAQMLRVGVERIRRMTGGSADIMLMTTNPSIDRWDTMEELAQAVRTVAEEMHVGLCDVSAAFHEAGKDPAARANLYAWDKTHLGKQGHELTAATALKAITGDN